MLILHCKEDIVKCFSCLLIKDYHLKVFHYKQANIFSNVFFLQAQASSEIKESEEKLVAKMKEGLNLSKDEKDKISEMPDDILINL